MLSPFGDLALTPVFGGRPQAYLYKVSSHTCVNYGKAPADLRKNDIYISMNTLSARKHKLQNASTILCLNDLCECVINHNGCCQVCERASDVTVPL